MAGAGPRCTERREQGRVFAFLRVHLGQSLVNTLDFIIDPKLAKTNAAPPEQEEEPLDNEVPLELWSAANTIHDKELRKSFLKTALLALKRKRQNDAD